MKTTKFLAMLLAAFALTFSFASCGDEEDEPDPTPNPSTEQITPNDDFSVPGDNDDNGNPGNGGNDSGTVTENVLKIKDVTINLKGAMAGGPSWGEHPHVEIRFETDYAGEYASVMIDLQNTAITNGQIPTGSYPFLTDDEDARSYQIFGDIIKNQENYAFLITPGAGNLKIERSGDIYTLTIEKLKVDYWNVDTFDEETVTTSFKYKGKIEIPE